MPAGSGRYPSGQRGQTVNLLAYAFGGSNPPLPTTDPGGNSSAVERQPSKLGVAGSNPVSRSTVATSRRAARVEGGLSEMRGAALADIRGLGETRGAPLADIAGGLSEMRGAALADIRGLGETRGAPLADMRVARARRA